MKYFILLFFLGLISCSVLNKDKYLTVSNFQEKKFLFSKEDSIVILKEEKRLQKFSDSCKKFKLDCLFCGVDIESEFIGGNGKFREIFIKNLIIPKNTKPSKNKIRIIIGKNGSIKSVEVIDYKDERVKKEIVRVLNLSQLNQWTAAKNFTNYTTDFSIIFYLNIKQKI